MGVSVALTRDPTK